MVLNKEDSFLIGHARRMRENRKRQRQQDPKVYAEKLKIQQAEYRRRTRFHVLSESRMRQKLDSLITVRKATRERQRRYRLNCSNEKKNLQREKDRNYRLLKRKQEQLICSNKNLKT